MRETSNKVWPVGLDQFAGRVAVVVSVVRNMATGKADAVLTGLNSAFPEFGHRRVQLLAEIDGDPQTVSERLSLSMPVVSGNGFGEHFGALLDADGRMSSVILGNDGEPLDVVHQAPGPDHHLAVLAALDRLVDQYPDRFTVLPDADASAESVGPDERLDDSSDRVAHMGDPTEG